MHLEELRRIVQFHGPTVVARVARTHASCVHLWTTGRFKPLEIRVKWIQEKLTAPPAELMEPMTRQEIRARLDSIGGYRAAAKKMGIHEVTIQQWLVGKQGPSPRNRVALRKHTPAVEPYTDEDMAPMSREELIRIIRAIGMDGICAAVGCSRETPRNWIEGKSMPIPRFRARLRRAYRERCS